MNWMLLPLRRYADFQGRSRRREYWMFVLFVVLVVAVAGIAMIAANGSFPSRQAMQVRFTVWAGFALLPFILPLIAVSVRRLHDLGLSGWWMFAFVIGGAILAIDTLAALAQIIVMALPGRKLANRFGDNPKATLPTA